MTIAAEIIAAGATPDFRTVTIDKGSRDGLRTDMAIIAPGGVVGRVAVPSARAAKVQLLIDRNAAAGAIIERSRAQGVVIGGGDERLRMDYVSEAADIAVGDLVMTSGIDGIYPKGFAIGRVESVEKNGPAYSRIAVKPAVDFSGAGGRARRADADAGARAAMGAPSEGRRRDPGDCGGARAPDHASAASSFAARWPSISSSSWSSTWRSPPDR